ncbi:RNA-directed DNA polymerase, eukaryota, reverse transcriptase zinc-binding domain protein [Tanacetum coccineum]
MKKLFRQYSDVTHKEIKEVMFDIDSNKSLGPDGFTSKFFKKTWNIVGNDVCLAIKDFFQNSKLLGEINSTLIALIPKVSAPRRHIQDNILIAQELLKGYNRKNGPKRCAMQIDIHKAYDTVSWSFLEDILVKFRFHKKMISWIMTCVKSTSFPICLNGDMHGFFKRGRGLRQGDLISPYLFTLVMEVFSLIMEKNIEESSGLGYNFGCKELKLSHMCFADDLLVLCKGNRESIKVIKKSIDEFSQVSGLIPNLGKSVIFFGSINERDKIDLLQVLPFKCGKLPVRYLGGPLLAKKLGVSDCKVLCDKEEERINNWRNKTLSYVGRIQLIASVLSSMQQYWALVYLLPATVIHELEKLFKMFLWNAGDSAKGKARVSWKVGWKTMLTIRDEIRDHVWYEIGDNARVVDMIRENQWVWHDGWKENYTILINLNRTMNLVNNDDKVLWITNDGDKLKFNTKQTWEDLRFNWPIVNWSNVVWFNQLIPRQAFILWMAVQDKLLTQDKVEKWDHKVSFKMKMHIKLSDIVSSLARRKGVNNIGNVVDKLVLAATVYFIWQERNYRLFKGEKRSEEMILTIIGDSVRSKLMIIKVKQTLRTNDIAKKWDLQWRNQYLIVA